jgi:hypothetical protein
MQTVEVYQSSPIEL